MARRVWLVLALVACDGSTSGGGGSPDAAPVQDDASLPYEGPLATTPGSWTYVPFPTTTCAHGTPAGVAIQPPPGGLGASDELLVYIEGGGACWDSVTCFVLNSAVRIDAQQQGAYTAQTFDGQRAVLDAAKIFDRTDTASPFKDATFVYVPYCTGDLHAGTMARSYEHLGNFIQVRHVGGTNMQAFVDELATALPGLSRIWVGGSSAGGYGATFSHHRFVAAWPGAEVHVLQDASPFVANSNWGTWRTTWQVALPPGCTGCDAAMSPVLDAVSSNTTTRLALLTTLEDATIKLFFGYGLAPMTAATNTMLDTYFDQPNTEAFVLGGDQHVLIFGYDTIVHPDGVSLREWIRRWAVGDPAWDTAR